MGPSELRYGDYWGPRVIDVFDGNGRHRVQLAHFFRGQIGSWTPSRVGLVVGSRLHRIRRRCSRLVLSEGFGSKIGLLIAKSVRAAERIRPKMPRSGGACGVGECTCIVPTLSDPRETTVQGLTGFGGAAGGL